MQTTSRLLFESFSVLNKRKVKCLLIGGQACVIYGAKTSTVDLDLTILVSDQNLKNLITALEEFAAISSPASSPLEIGLLRRGHSLHYYCNSSLLQGLRLDILGHLPRLEPFKNLWKRRFEIISDSGVVVPILSIPDLIQSKKTGRLKDAADISALVGSHYTINHLSPSDVNIELWLMEAREVEMLMMFVGKFVAQAQRLISKRPLLKYALEHNISLLKTALLEEASKEAIEHESFRGPLRNEIRERARAKRV